MKLRRRQQKAATPLERLLQALDAVAATDGNYGPYAAGVAADIRREGPRAAEVHLARAAPFVAESFGATARLNPAIGALSAWGRAVLGVDVESMPSADIRRRRAADRLRERVDQQRQRLEDAQLRHHDASLIRNLRGPSAR